MQADDVSAMPLAWARLGLAVGHGSDDVGATGCTVLRGVSEPFRCAATVIGRASGSRELATCQPDHLVDRTDAILLTGGSAYGLDAAAGVMRWMEEHGRGFPVGPGVVPIVPAAVIFDLAPLGLFSARPTADMAYAACADASSTGVAEGCVGAGTGALVGKYIGVESAMKGGIGIGVAESGGLLAVALAVVNAFGDVRDANGRIIAGARAMGGGFVDAQKMLRSDDMPSSFSQMATEGRRNTTLAVVAISVPLSKTALSQLAMAASAAFYRRITPCGTAFDGDVLFAVAPLAPLHGFASDDIPPTRIEAVAQEALELAIERGVTTARGRDGFPGLADFS